MGRCVVAIRNVVHEFNAVNDRAENHSAVNGGWPASFGGGGADDHGAGDAPTVGLRIAHVSDFHFRRWNAVLTETKRLLQELDYDVLVATGDFCSRPGQFKRAAEMCRRFFDDIRPRLGTFAVLGNHDDRRLAYEPNLPLQFLCDANEVVTGHRNKMVFAGVDQSCGHEGRVAAALAGTSSDQIVVFLAHYPSTVYRVPPGRVNLVLAGHTHGGQIRLPRLGCIWNNDDIPLSMSRGFHIVDGTPMNVSAGIGVSPPIWCRLLCPPEISLIELRPSVLNTGRSPRSDNHARNLFADLQLASGV